MTLTSFTPRLYLKIGNKRSFVHKYCDAAMTAVESEPYSFPGRESWIGGVRYSPDVTREAFKAFKEFDVHKDDVFVCGYPRSGNTWLLTIIDAIFHQNDLERFTATARYSNIYFLEGNSKIAREYPKPVMFNSHAYYDVLPVALHEKKPKIINIIRNPKDVGISYYHYHKTLTPLGPWKGTWDVFFEAFVNGEVFFGSWLDHVMGYLDHKDDSNLMLIKYEDLRKQPRKWIKKVAEFIDRPLTDEQLNMIVQITAFDQMKKHPLNPSFNSDHWLFAPGREFMRSGRIGSWKYALIREQSDALEALMKTVKDAHGVVLQEE